MYPLARNAFTIYLPIISKTMLRNPVYGLITCKFRWWVTGSSYTFNGIIPRSDFFFLFQFPSSRNAWWNKIFEEYNRKLFASYFSILQIYPEFILFYLTKITILSESSKRLRFPFRNCKELNGAIPNLTVTVSPVTNRSFVALSSLHGVFTSVHGPSRSFLELTRHARQRCLPLAGEPCVKLTRELCVICHSSLLAAPSLDFAVIPMAAPSVNDPLHACRLAWSSPFQSLQ